MSRTRAFFYCAHLLCLRGILFALLACLLAIGAPTALAQGAGAAGEQPKPAGVIRVAEREPPNRDLHLR